MKSRFINTYKNLKITGSFFSQLFVLCFFSSPKGQKDKLFGKRTRNHLFHVLQYCFYKITVEESEAYSLFQKEKRGSAKSDVFKVLFSDIGKITNLLVADDRDFVYLVLIFKQLVFIQSSINQ